MCCLSPMPVIHHHLKRKIVLLKDTSWVPQPSNLLSIMPPNELSLKRQWYIYVRIREFFPLKLRFWYVLCQESACYHFQMKRMNRTPILLYYITYTLDYICVRTYTYNDIL